MKVQMRALRRCYVPSLQGEFKAGQTFEAENEKEARRLSRRRTAEIIGGVVEAKSTGRDQLFTTPVENNDDSLEALREKYKKLTGNDPDARWGARRLQNETARYNRRDMRAED